MRRFFPIMIAALTATSACETTEHATYEHVIAKSDYLQATHLLAGDFNQGNIVPEVSGSDPDGRRYRADYHAAVRSLITVWMESSRPPTTGYEFRTIASLAQTAQLPWDDIAKHAQHAFAAYRSNTGDRPEDRWLSNMQADEVADMFRGAIDDVRHNELVARIWSRGACCTGVHEAFRKRHPMTPSVARRAYDLAIEEGDFTQARILAQQNAIGEAEYREARARELEAAVTRELGTNGSLARALEAARQPEANLSPAIIERARSIARGHQAYEIALAFADLMPTRDRERREIAMLLFEQQLERAPIEAYRTALAYELPPWHLRRARDLAFRRAAETGAFILAQRLPDGSFMVLKE